jgi:hypothetical protein
MAPERRVWLVAAFAVAVAACGAAPGRQDDSANEWPAYGRDKDHIVAFALPAR